MKKILQNIAQAAVLFVLVAVVFVLFALVRVIVYGPTDTVSSFTECVEAGNPIVESYPAQCRTPSGKVFVKDIGNEHDKEDIIYINTPRPNSLVVSPLVIEGEARGTWFFEGDFPVQLLDGDGREVAVGFVSSNEEWMTEAFIPYYGELVFEIPNTTTGTLILKKDNPTGLPEHDDMLYVPVRF